jgi:hypothetical protein
MLQDRNVTDGRFRLTLLQQRSDAVKEQKVTVDMTPFPSD